MKEKKKGGGEGSPGLTPAGSLLLMLTLQQNETFHRISHEHVCVLLWRGEGLQPTEKELKTVHRSLLTGRINSASRYAASF